MEVQEKERQLDPELGGVLNLRHQGHHFPEGWGEGERREWCECKQLFTCAVKKLRKLLRNMLSFLGQMGGEIIC